MKNSRKGKIIEASVEKPKNGSANENVQTKNAEQKKSSERKENATANTCKEAPSITNDANSPEECLIPDDEVILMGNCRLKKYGDVKNTAAWKSFLVWVKTSSTTYKNPDQQKQFNKLKELAKRTV